MTKMQTYRSEDLCKEILRRTRKGSQLIQQYYSMPPKFMQWPSTRETGRRIKKDSQRYHYLRMILSDRDLMHEMMHRIVFIGCPEAYYEFEFMTNELTNMLKSVKTGGV